MWHTSHAVRQTGKWRRIYVFEITKRQQDIDNLVKVTRFSLPCDKCLVEYIFSQTLFIR